VDTPSYNQIQIKNSCFSNILTFEKQKSLTYVQAVLQILDVYPGS